MLDERSSGRARQLGETRRRIDARRTRERGGDALRKRLRERPPERRARPCGGCGEEPALDRVEALAGKDVAPHLGRASSGARRRPLPARVEDDGSADADVRPEQTAAPPVGERAVDEGLELDGV